MMVMGGSRWQGGLVMGVLLSMVGCAGGTATRDSASSTLPSRVYHVGREEAWDAALKVALSIPTWELVSIDEPSGVVFVEQRVRDRSSGGESRMAIAVTALDETQTKVEVRTMAEGAPRGQRTHSVWRFLGELDQLLPSSDQREQKPR
jgi:hypothetical protein